jgi:hypothetical protein
MLCTCRHTYMVEGNRLLSLLSPCCSHETSLNVRNFVNRLTYDELLARLSNNASRGNAVQYSLQDDGTVFLRMYIFSVTSYFLAENYDLLLLTWRWLQWTNLSPTLIFGNLHPWNTQIRCKKPSHERTDRCLCSFQNNHYTQRNGCQLCSAVNTSLIYPGKSWNENWLLVQVFYFMVSTWLLTAEETAEFALTDWR